MKVLILSALVVAVYGQGYGYGGAKNHLDGHAIRPAHANVAPGAVLINKAERIKETPKPYQFSYEVKDEFGNQHHRHEAGDESGTVLGAYGYTDAYGLFRQVEYSADDYGFKAKIKTNEPGTDNQNPADVEVYADPTPIKYEEPKKAYAAGQKQVIKAPSYQAPAYRVGGPLYGPSVPHRSGYIAPQRTVSKVVTNQRGYAPRGGYGHTTKVVSHEANYLHPVGPARHAGRVAHLEPITHAVHKEVREYSGPVHHGAALNHQRGYDRHDGGYGHSSRIVAHGLY